jgi:hypothetical protein
MELLIKIFGKGKDLNALQMNSRDGLLFFHRAAAPLIRLADRPKQTGRPVH